MNLYGDLEDSREEVVYQFFHEDKKLSRKSCQGYFQILMEPIYSVFFNAYPVDFEQKGGNRMCQDAIPTQRVR